MGRVEIVPLRVGARAKEGKGGGGGEIKERWGMWKIGESRNSTPKGRCQGERRIRGRGRGDKRYACRYNCSFGKLRTLANGALDWCGIGK